LGTIRRITSKRRATCNDDFVVLVMVFAFNELEHAKRADKPAAGTPLSLMNDVQGSDLFNDLFCCG
jgi:hypothetical protein